nr:hypothetical protein [Tanacetum cinerariifolium]
MLLFVASLLQETYNGHKLLKESDLKPGPEFLESNITLSLQQENRLKQMGTTVTNASSYTERSKEIETKIEGIGVFTVSNDTMNDDTPIGIASTVQDGVTPSLVDMMVEMEKKNSLKDTIVLGSFPPLATPGTTTVGNASGKSSYANVTGKSSGKKPNFCTLFTPGGNGIDVVVPVENTWGKYGLVRSMFSLSTRLFSFQFSSMDGLDAMLENGPWFIWNNPLILKKCHPNENLIKEDISTVPVWVKLHGVPVTDFSEDGLSVIATKLGAGEKKTVKKPSQTSRGVLVGPKIGFKHHKEYRLVPKKSTTSSSGNKKKGEEPNIEVSNSNPFDVLNSVDNDVEFDTNGETTNLVNNGATSSGFSFMSVDNSSFGTTPIIEKIKNFKDLLTSGQAILVNKDDNPLKKVEFLGEDDSENEVASVDNDMARSMAYERGHDLSHELQAICDNLDIRVRGHKKK